jgi:predicted nuclease of predicted toxin-antitoxin system
MKILLDMSLSPQWKITLSRAGFEAVHWSEIGAANDPDQIILDFARASAFVVFTQDLDFGILLARNRQDRPSVIQVRTKDVFPSVIGPHVIAALHQMEQELENGALLTIDPHRYRIRSLPLR